MGAVEVADAGREGLQELAPDGWDELDRVLHAPVGDDEQTGVDVGGDGGGGPLCKDPGPDEDFDKDGYSIKEGDCNDCDANVNPGAIEAPTLCSRRIMRRKACCARSTGVTCRPRPAARRKH